MRKFFSHRSEARIVLILLLTFLFSSLPFTRALADDTHTSQYRFTPKIYKGREIAPPMSYLGADWLEREERHIVSGRCQTCAAWRSGE